LLFNILMQTADDDRRQSSEARLGPQPFSTPGVAATPETLAVSAARTEGKFGSGAVLGHDSLVDAQEFETHYLPVWMSP
jgi:hypothetical protein